MKLLSARFRSILILMTVIALMACAAPPNRPSAGEIAPASSVAPSAGKTLTMAIRYEPNDLESKIGSNAGADFVKRPFNAGLGLIDGTGSPRPYLAQALPELNTESWRVSPDGRMETIHRLRPGLTWHDGAPLTADDFAFAFQVYTTPGLGVFSQKPLDRIEEVLAPDPLTVVTRWRSLYPDASALTENKDGNLEPLPRHLLDTPFRAVLADPGSRDRFLTLPFWTVEYVGAGPYRLEHWDPGNLLQAVAFADHALGKPKIERIMLRIMQDENAVLTNMLAHSLDMATRFTLRFEHAMVLKREWESGRQGEIQWGPTNIHPLVFQFRPDYLKTPELLDLRIRKALAHAIDRQALLDGLFEGEGMVADTFLAREEPLYPEVDREITKYAFDFRRSEQLMSEAGYSKDREGLFVTAAGDRFAPDYQTQGGTLFERGQAIVAEGWRRAGFDARPSVLPAALIRDVQARQTFPAIATLGNAGPDFFLTSEIGSPATRWAGQNRGGWAHPDYDPLWDAYNTMLVRSERHRPLVRMMKLLSDEVPGFALYYAYQPNFTFFATVQGPDIGTTTTTPFWNLQDWEVR
jgi:peptide/nickel transport system substrate-binding protein